MNPWKARGTEASELGRRSVTPSSTAARRHRLGDKKRETDLREITAYRRSGLGSLWRQTADGRTDFDDSYPGETTVHLCAMFCG